MNPASTEERPQQRAVEILDLIPDALVTIDSDGAIEFANQSAERLFGASAHELAGSKVSAFLSASRFDDLKGNCSEILDRSDRTDESTREMTVRGPHGELLPVEVTVCRMNGVNSPHCLLVVRDISERRALELDVLRISEDERQRIGQDIHDHLASKFSGLAMMVRGLLSRLRSNPGYTVEPEMLETLIEHARKGAEMARTLSRGLNPVKVEERGLEAALQELGHEVEALSDISCDVAFHSSVPDLEPSTASQLYRIAHEAVTNAMKHARARRIKVSLERAGASIRLSVRDDGKGMPTGGPEADGMGIHIMKYRAGVIHGRLVIDSVPNEGTAVVCRVPIRG